MIHGDKPFLSCCSFAGFDPIGDTKITSDGGWGCMLRSSQMLVAQVCLFNFYIENALGDGMCVRN